MEEHVLENGMIGRDFRHGLLKSAADVNSFDDPECQNLEGKSAEFRWTWFFNGIPEMQCHAVPTTSPSPMWPYLPSYTASPNTASPVYCLGLLNVRAVYYEGRSKGCMATVLFI